MADVKLNSLATKTNANAAAILVKDSATQNQGAEGWITKAQLNQIIRDEVKAQLSAITSGTPDVPVLDGSTMKYMTLANFAKVVGGQMPVTGLSSFLTLKGAPNQLSSGSDLNSLTTPGSYHAENNTISQSLLNAPTGRFGNSRVIVITNTGSDSNQYGWQIYMDMYKIWIRSRQGSTWIGWTLLLEL